MLLHSFRYLLIIFCSMYTYYKLLNTKNCSLTQQSACILFSLILSITLNTISDNIPCIKLIIMIIGFVLFIAPLTHTTLPFSLMLTTISLAISFIYLSIIGFLLSILVTLISQKRIATNPSFILLGGLIQIIATYKTFKIKRLRNGMPFLYHKNVNRIGIILSTTMLILYFILQEITLSSLSAQIVLFFFVLTIYFSLFLWWKRKITQEYVEKLRLEEREDLYNQIAAKEMEIKKLQTDNEHLGRIIHKDNKLIPAMEYAVCNYLQTISQMNNNNITQQIENPLLHLQQHGEDLILQLKHMTSEREGILNTYERNFNTHPQMGIPSIDAVIQYMEKRAVQSGIRYRIRFDNNLDQCTLKHIEEHDILHLLSDLIENAIIAASHSDRKEILVHLGFSYENLFFDIYDSGVPFTIETYQNLGSQQYTTYADSGGSGIGLMDIWKLKRKYKASLQIYEYPIKDNIYSKKIRILFDHKNHFLIQTYRVKEIQANIIRSDLYLFPHRETSNPDRLETISNQEK